MLFFEFCGNVSVFLFVCDKKRFEIDYGSWLENIKYGIRIGIRIDFFFFSWGFFFFIDCILSNFVSIFVLYMVCFCCIFYVLIN